MTMHEGIRQCLINPDDSEALACIKREIKESKDSCPARLVFLYQTGCDSCKEQKEAFKSDIESGDIKLINVQSAEGKEITSRNNIGAVPALVILDCENNIIE